MQRVRRDQHRGHEAEQQGGCERRHAQPTPPRARLQQGAPTLDHQDAKERGERQQVAHFRQQAPVGHAVEQRHGKAEYDFAPLALPHHGPRARGQDDAPRQRDAFDERVGDPAKGVGAGPRRRGAPGQPYDVEDVEAQRRVKQDGNRDGDRDRDRGVTEALRPVRVPEPQQGDKGGGEQHRVGAAGDRQAPQHRRRRGGGQRRPAPDQGERHAGQGSRQDVVVEEPGGFEQSGKQQRRDEGQHRTHAVTLHQDRRVRCQQHGQHGKHDQAERGGAGEAEPDQTCQHCGHAQPC